VTWTTNYAPQASGVIQQTKTGAGSQSLAYDYFGNSTSQLPHAVRRITSGCTSTGVCYTPGYDGKGRTTATVRGLGLSYTAFDLPRTVTDLVNGVDGNGDGVIDPAATYKYDANNNRVFKTYNGQTTASIGGLYERRVSTSGVVSHVMYIRGPNERVVAQETWTESGSSVTTSPILYHHDDIVGSTVVANTAATSASATRLRYDPFGLRINPINPTQAPAAPPTRIGFTGHDMDDEFNLINMKGRIYDPKIARFLTPDPIVSAPYSGNGYDRYGYVLNNPLKYTDPSGFMQAYADIWLGLQGYDMGFVGFMASFNRAVDAKIAADWDAREIAKEAGRQDARGVLADRVGKVPVRVSGGTGAQRNEAFANIKKILTKTTRGQAMLAELSKKKAGNEVRTLQVSIRESPAGSNWDPSTSILTVDLRQLEATYVSYGGELFNYSMTRIIAHELGHAAFGIDDIDDPIGGKSMWNVHHNENPIMRELGDPNNRMKYHKDDP
jgi:RHS repeat-associated protein